MNSEKDTNKVPDEAKVYRLIVSSYADEFEQMVNALIHKGWEPLGGPSVLPVGDSVSLVQAMTYRAKKIY